MDLLDVWPLFRLRLLTPRLELRPIRDEDLPGLAEAALAGVHDSDRMPFAGPWTEAPAEQLVPDMARYFWSQRAALRPDDWTVLFAVLEDGVPIGVQDLRATDFGALRTVSSGSWLTRSRQGFGLGTEMRAALLAFAFDHLGAEVAESGVFDWNVRSLGVSAKLGYRENGRRRVTPKPGVVETEMMLRIEPAWFVRPDWTLGVEGAAEARAALIA
ncbi:GNAT family N-acetyltransferase [Agromyces soli]